LQEVRSISVLAQVSSTENPPSPSVIGLFGTDVVGFVTQGCAGMSSTTTWRSALPGTVRNPQFSRDSAQGAVNQPLVGPLGGRADAAPGQAGREGAAALGTHIPP